jgi:hypothetical protein
MMLDQHLIAVLDAAVFVLPILISPALVIWLWRMGQR